MYFIVLDDGDLHNSHVVTLSDIPTLEEAYHVAVHSVSDLIILGYRNVFCLVRKHEQIAGSQTICSFSQESGWENVPESLITTLSEKEI